MNILILISRLLLIISLIGILQVFVLYPLFLFLISFFKKREIRKPSHSTPKVSLLVVVRDAQDLIENKIKNFLSLKYPVDRLEMIVFSDGSTDSTENLIKSYEGIRLRYLSSSTHLGKTQGINNAISSCSGEIVVFSDADATLNDKAIERLVSHFSNPEIGGVCGLRVIAKDNVPFKEAQSGYVNFDSAIKKLESQIGSITSNDGKLYGIRRELFQPIADTVTDDLYNCLSVIKQGRRFIFEPEAKAYIKAPSRSKLHELKRRRRIVARSLKGIYLKRALLNPYQYGRYSISLITNKILRRLLPIFLIILFCSSLFLSIHSAVIKIFLSVQIAFYLSALSYPFFSKRSTTRNLLKTITAQCYYFSLGMLGTLLGLMDFIRGKQLKKWDPIKSD